MAIEVTSDAPTALLASRLCQKYWQSTSDAGLGTSDGAASEVSQKSNIHQKLVSLPRSFTLEKSQASSTYIICMQGSCRHTLDIIWKQCYTG